MGQTMTTALIVIVLLSLTPICASARVRSTSQEVAVLLVIQGAMNVMVQETPTAILASLEETLLMGVNATPKSTMTEVLVLTATVIAQSARGQVVQIAQNATLERF